MPSRIKVKQVVKTITRERVVRVKVKPVVKPEHPLLTVRVGASYRFRGKWHTTALYAYRDIAKAEIAVYSIIYCDKLFPGLVDWLVAQEWIKPWVNKKNLWAGQLLLGSIRHNRPADGPGFKPEAGGGSEYKDWVNKRSVKLRNREVEPILSHVDSDEKWRWIINDDALAASSEEFPLVQLVYKKDPCEVPLRDRLEMVFHGVASPHSPSHKVHKDFVEYILANFTEPND